MAARPPDLNDWYTRDGLQVRGGGITMRAGGAIKGGQTKYNTGSGFFLGYADDNYKFSIGNSATGNYLTWDGTTLTVAGTISLASVPWSSVTGAGKPADNADVTLSAVNGGLSVTGGGITLSGGGAIKGGQTAYATGTGFFLGYSGSAYKFSIGDSSNYLRWTGTAIEVAGAITGSSTIDITGEAKFSGIEPGYGGVSTALHGNYGLAAVSGVMGRSNATLATHAATGVGVYGIGLGTEAFGVIGSSANKVGVSGVSGGTAPGGIGVRAYNTSSGYGLYAYSNTGFAIYCDGYSFFTQPIYGSIIGDVTGNCSGSSGSCTGNAASASYATSAGSASTATYATRSGEVYNSSNVSMYAGNNTYQCMLQASDGNLVVYNASMSALWSWMYGPSDQRLKSNIQPTAKNGLATINALKIRDYKWTTGPRADGRTYTGFIAQEVQEVLPTAVGKVGEDSDVLGMDREAIIPFLVKAIQELSDEIKTLRAAQPKP